MTEILRDNLAGAGLFSTLCVRPLSQLPKIARNHRVRRWLIAMVAAASWLCMGFDKAEVSEARDRVIDDAYQTELPEFADAAPEDPLSFLDGDHSDAADADAPCDPAVDADCEQDDSGSGGAGDDTGDGDGSNTPESAGDDRGSSSFWEHEAELEPSEAPEPPDLDIPDGLLLVLQTLGITVLVVVVLLIIWRITLAVSNRSETAESSVDDTTPDSGASLRDNAPTRPHADLAAEEHYDEAIHRLLLEVLDSLTERQRGLASPSLTARELLRRARIDDESHRHLAALVRAVEEILFARRSADAAKYEACVDHYRAIVKALGQQGTI